MTRQPPPDLSQPHVFIVILTLRPSLSRAKQRRFYGQMRRAMHGLDLLLCQSHGIGLLVPLGRQPARDFREAVLGWLIDQHEPKHIIVQPLMPARECLDVGISSLRDPDDGIDPARWELASQLFVRMLLGLLLLRDSQRAQLGLSP